jgi:DNA-binding transcriptional LysR family regulator
MDLKLLRTFVTVAEHGTVSKAAAVLHATQPALSRQIRMLEAQLGFALFDRQGRRLILSARGEQLLGDCRAILACVSSLGERAQALRRGDLKVLRVVASALTIETLFPRFLHIYARAVPGVRLDLVEADAAAHLALLERGEAHLAVNVINTIHVDDHRFGSHVLPPFWLLAAACPDRAVGTDHIDIARLAAHPLLLLKDNYATRNVFDAACRLAGVRPEILAECSSANALLALAREGHGVAVIPSIMQPEPALLPTARVTFRGDPLRLMLAVLWDKRRTLPHYADSFAALLGAHIAETYPPESRAVVTGARAAPTPRRAPARAGR